MSANSSQSNSADSSQKGEGRGAANGAKKTRRLSPLARVVLGLVGWYRSTISPKNPGKCKYYPTCSTYMVIAVKRFGAIRGGLLGILRLLRCQPWVDGGIDDVPYRFSLFYRFRWSKAHEEPTLEPIVTLEDQLK